MQLGDKLVRQLNKQDLRVMLERTKASEAAAPFFQKTVFDSHSWKKKGHHLGFIIVLGMYVLLGANFG